LVRAHERNLGKSRNVVLRGMKQRPETVRHATGELHFLRSVGKTRSKKP